MERRPASQPDPLVGALAAFEAGNLALADILARDALAARGPNATALNLLGRIGLAIGEAETAATLFRRALEADPRFKAAAKNLREAEAAAERRPARPDPGYLVVQAWGCGFWSDVDHVLGQLLVCEMTGRRPIVHWGRSSRFGDGTGSNAWDLYFEPCSAARPEDVVGRGYRFYPAKWNEANFLDEDPDRLASPRPRPIGLHFLNRPEEVVVSEIHTDVALLLPWVRPGHPLHGLSVDDAYRRLARTHLRLRPEVADEIERAAAAHLTGPTIAVHFRGTDKFMEVPGLRESGPTLYRRALEPMLASLPGARIFLLTDDADAERDFRSEYGDRLLTLEAVRATGPVGLHFREGADGRRLALEVIRDVYLAARCDAFVGLGPSNVSHMVYHLKDWPDQRCVLLGEVRHRRPNAALHTPGMLESIARSMGYTMRGRAPRARR